jgi:hypothetical protein
MYRRSHRIFRIFLNSLLAVALASGALLTVSPDRVWAGSGAMAGWSGLSIWSGSSFPASSGVPNNLSGAFLVPVVSGNSSAPFSTSTGAPSGENGTYIAYGWANGSGTKYWKVHFSSTDFHGLTVSSQQMSTNLGSSTWNGPRNFKLQYSLNDSTWTDVSGSTLTLGSTWIASGKLTNLSLPAAVDNQPNVYLRWIMTSNTSVSASYPTTDSEAQSYISGIYINGTETPITPTDILLSGTTLYSGDPIGTLVGNLSVVDANIYDTWTYSLVSGGGSTDNASFNITGNQLTTSKTLAAGTYSIRINVNDGTNNFAKIFSITVTAYQPITGGDTSYGDYISNVTFAGINNTSAASTPGYQDFTTLTGMVTQGNGYPLSVSVKIGCPTTSTPNCGGTVYPAYIKVWFDWNHDFDFNDAGEEIDVVTSTVSSGPHTITINVPVTATLGTTRMRIVSNAGIGTPPPPPPNSGPSQFYGEAEDYTINISAALVNSIAPTAVQTINTATNGASLTVTENPAADSRQWKYGTTSGGPYDTNISGATGVSYSPNFATAGTYYVVCASTKSGITVTSNAVQVNVVTPTITTSAITGSPFYVSATQGASVNVPYTLTGAYAAGNVFSAYLSDASGNFTGETAIGTLAATNAGTINATIPAGTASGAGYRIRVKSNNPAVVGSNNGSNLTITLDTTAPVVSVPANATLEATGPGGATFTFTATATDLVAPLNPTAVCTPASGFMFPLSTTTVTCSATDTAGNTGSNTFTVTVQDTTAPTVNAFSASSPSTNLNIPITAFTASDSVGVTGYMVSTAANPPAANDTGWSGSAPSSFTVTGLGSYTLYPWVKDAAKNVSVPFSSPVGVVVCSASVIVANNADSGAGSLRQAIVDVCAGGTISFDASLAGQTITLTSGQLAIDKSMTINGLTTSPGVAISGNNAVRVFYVTAGTVALNNLAIQNGRNVPDLGGGLGGAGLYIVNAGTAVTLNNCAVVNNSLNPALASGGAIVVQTGTSLTMKNGTVSGNSSTFDAGGILNLGTLTLNSSTITNNSTPGGGGGLESASGTSTLRNTIVAGNSGPSGADCYTPGSPILSAGYNMVGTTNNCVISPSATDTKNFDFSSLLLGPLQNNGGPTSTHTLLPGSPAFEAIPGCNSAPATDQRGIARPQGVACDIGAVEVGVGTLTIATSGDGSGVITPSVGAHAYVVGASVPLTATADTGSTFTGWSGDTDCAGGVVTMDADKTCTATFRLIQAPTVSTAAASGVAATGATLNGTVNANFGSSTVTFEYGLDTSYGTTAAGVPGTVTGATATSVTAALSGLTVNTTYHYRVVAQNSAGTTQGLDQSFKTLNLPTTTTTITSDSPDPSVVGEAISFNYSVTVDLPDSGIPTGTVIVSDGTDSCSGSVSAGSCAITFTTPGVKALTATYSGDGSFSGSTSTGANHQVNKANTASSLTVTSGNSSPSGTAVTLTATVTVNAPGAGTPTGSVSFYEGANLLGVGTLDAFGVAKLDKPSMPYGQHTITAIYGGDSNFATSQKDSPVLIPWRFIMPTIHR